MQYEQKPITKTQENDQEKRFLHILTASIWVLSIPRTYSGDRALIDYNLCNLCDMTYDNKNDKKYAKTIT